MVNGEMKFGNESQLSLLAAGFGDRLTSESGDERFVISEESEINDLRENNDSGEERSKQLGAPSQKWNTVAEEG